MIEYAGITFTQAEIIVYAIFFVALGVKVYTWYRSRENEPSVDGQWNMGEEKYE